ncbi:uncharacterized protein [Montipora foliosa]|uniref:uncharacterized protein n=1 Tax=Montipora foliosa TaxID=591990 RepID=UPI0035F1B2A5
MKKVLSDQTNDVKLIFHELMEIPGYYLIMDTEHINGKVNDIAMSRLVENTWPIMVFTILLAGISGMCVWILETFFNEEEFPRSFTRGTYEGFWWAFVSMTTVGYGDKTPKFVFGRLFGVIWILFGLIVIAVFTATATSSLSISATDLAVVGGRKIGVLVNTSAELQARQRGAKVNVFTTVDKVFSKLKENKIDGVFMERYRAAYYLSEALNDSTLKVFGSYDHEVVYDVAVRDSPSAKSQMGKGSCFEQELERFDVDDILLDYLKPVDVYEGSDLQSFLSGKSKGTQNFLLVTLGIFVGLLFSGFITELLYIKLWKPTRKVQSREGEIDLNEARTQSDFTKAINLKDVEDKLGQLIREISKLQEQLTVISSQANGFYNTGQDTAYM